MAIHFRVAIFFMSFEIEKILFMKSGKIILGVAAVFATIGSSLAFNAVQKFRVRKVYGRTEFGIGCRLCISLWTNLGLVGKITIKTCKDFNGNTLYASKTRFAQLRTAAWHSALTINGIRCTDIHQITKVTIRF